MEEPVYSLLILLAASLLTSVYAIRLLKIDRKTA
jgi:hypothetical protein